MTTHSDNAASSLSELFSALSHPVRVKILSLLKDHEHDVTDLQRELGISQSNVSQHLTQLKLHGLVNQRREGKHVFYQLKSPEIALLITAALNVIAIDMVNNSEVIQTISEFVKIWGM